MTRNSAVWIASVLLGTGGLALLVFNMLEYVLNRSAESGLVVSFPFRAKSFPCNQAL
ncbi:MAG: hypothetical protein WAU32_08200 [Thermoanaerobaculia bacterium]